MLTAGAVFVVLALLGFVLYAGMFIFLGVVIYLLIMTIKDEFFKPKCRRKLEDSRIIEMGEVEIIPPEKDKK